jgi:glycine/D-amino acid oxidase-like deaminating enzyme
VTLCEKGQIAAEQSSRNWGWCRVMGRDPAEIPLAMESLRMWREMNNRTGGETGFRQAGTMYLCVSQRELDQLAEWLEHARAWQLDTRLLDGNEVAAMLPGMQHALPVACTRRVTDVPNHRRQYRRWRWRHAEQWGGGLIDATPDAVPVISGAPTLPGFYLATGFSGHGFGLGPAAGRLMADLVVGDRPLVDPTPYAFARFKQVTRLG